MILLGQFFYRSWIAVILLSPLFYPFYVDEKKKKSRKKSHELGIQFRDAIQSVSTSQKAGYSTENAFIAAQKDMELLHGKHSPICTTLGKIAKGLSNNIILEKLLYDLGEQSKNADIKEFAKIFAASKRSGGKMTETMASTIELIGNRMDIEKEIDVLISAKKTEAKIMEAVPFGIVFYIGLSNKNFFDPLYYNLMGIILMTFCMIIYIVAYIMAEKIVEIEM
ncbi:MAG: hypothetical protein KA965_01840 [Butyrivibrio sp.]|nr:hypothetical protein [Butyrivibrio sp.]